MTETRIKRCAAAVIFTAMLTATAMSLWQVWRDRRERAVIQTLLDAYAYGDTSLIVLDEKSNIIQMNEAAERLTGWRYEELINKPSDIIMPIEFRELHHKKFLASRGAGKHSVGYLPCIVVNKVGAGIPVGIVTRPFENGVIGIIDRRIEKKKG